MFIQVGDVVPLGAVVSVCWGGRDAAGEGCLPYTDAQAAVAQNLFVGRDRFLGGERQSLGKPRDEFADRGLLRKFPQASI